MAVNYLLFRFRIGFPSDGCVDGCPSRGPSLKPNPSAFDGPRASFGKSVSSLFRIRRDLLTNFPNPSAHALT